MWSPYPSQEALDFDAAAKRYAQALDDFLGKVRLDEQVLAVVLLGSMAYDRVWHKSDIDVDLIVKDQKLTHDHYNFTEQEVIFSAQIMQRTEFCRMVEGALTGSIAHSMLRRGKVVFLRDEALSRYFEDIARVGDRDRDLMYLPTASIALGELDKAEKWLYMRGDAVYAYHWLVYALWALASLEVLSHNDVPMRESLQQAMAYNPAFFEPLYKGLCDQPKTLASVAPAIAACRQYIRDRSTALFRAVIDYLKEEKEPRSVTDLCRHFGKKGVGDTHVFFCAMEWLAELGLVQKLSLPALLTPKSRRELEEAAYIAADE